MKANIETVNVRDAVSAVELMVEPHLAAKRLDCVVDIPPDVRVMADPARFRQILLTLLSNAVRFTESGHVMVDVGYPQGMREDVVMVRVGDSGSGMPREMHAEIFESSVHPRNGQQASARGIGPGLATCRDWARDMGGDIRVRSDEGRGSVFTLTLPRG